LLATPDVTALQQSDLNDFLFADVGTEANGMTLSVVSVFARCGNDPWQEAGRLAILSKAEATDSLARMIAAMPRSLWDLPAAAAIAGRLTALLPVRPIRASAAGPSGRVLSGQWPTARWPTARVAVVLACLALVAAYAVSTTMHSAPTVGPTGGITAAFSRPTLSDPLSQGTHP
jgi:hypothetical protein